MITLASSEGLKKKIILPLQESVRVYKNLRVDVCKLSLTGAVCLATIAVIHYRSFRCLWQNSMKCVAQKKGEPFVNLFKKLFCILIEYAKVSVTRSLYDEYKSEREVEVHSFM